MEFEYEQPRDLSESPFGQGVQDGEPARKSKSVRSDQVRSWTLSVEACWPVGGSDRRLGPSCWLRLTLGLFRNSLRRDGN